MGVFFYIQKGLPILPGGGIAYEHLLKERRDAQKVVSSMQKPGYERILKEQRDAQNSVSNGGADRKADKGKRHSVMGVFFICTNLIRFPWLV